MAKERAMSLFRDPLLKPEEVIVDANKKSISKDYGQKMNVKKALPDEENKVEDKKSNL